MRIMYHYLYEELYKEGEYKNKEPAKEGEYKNKEPDDKMKRSLQLVNRLYGEKTVDFNNVSWLRKHCKWLIYFLKMAVK